MNIEDIDTFEELNSPISVNVYKWEENGVEKVVPFHVSKVAPSFGQNEDKHVDLLLLTDGESHHYALIRSMSRLISFTTNHDGKQELCEKCLKRFATIKDAHQHAKSCVSTVDVCTEMVYPQPGSKLYFKNNKNQLRHPFIIYADFETLNAPVELPQNIPKTYKLFDQQVCSFGYIYMRSDGHHPDPITYRGKYAGVHFLKEMDGLYGEIVDYPITNQKPLNMTPEDEAHFQATS